MRFRPKLTWGGVTDTDFFLFIGRVEEIKGIDVLLRAFASMPDQKLVIAGSGPALEDYKAKTSDNVKFAGFLEKPVLANTLTRAKAVIMSSQLYEGFPMAIVEAFAAHKPVIAGDIGNVGTLIDSGSNGFKFQYNSDKALVDAIKIFNRMDSKVMGENAYRKYCEQLTPESNYCLLEDIYKQINKP